MRGHLNSLFLSCLLTLILCFCSCGTPQNTSISASGTASNSVKTSSAVSGNSRKPTSTVANSKHTRWDNAPKVLTPVASGVSVLQADGLEIDVSHTANGYIMVRYSGTADKIKFFIVTPDEVRYTYDLPVSADYMALPLTGGSGTYTLDVREHVEADLYSNLYKQTLEVTLEDEFQPFLYPNQYTWFTADSKAVALASELAEDAADGLEVIGNIYNYVIQNISYDEQKARTVQSGYLPDVDETLASGKGICFDYAALMTAMLRSQGIPTKLEIGYSGEVYHAWISAYIDEIGWVDQIIQFDGEHWSLIDPTLGASNDPDDLQEYLGDGSNYTVKYSR